jgi:nucleotide-binding universal stress UspA family protein
MFEKILYPTDFSDVSKKAMDFIKQLKGAGTKEVVVFHVIDERILDRIQHHSETGINVEVIEKKMEENAQEEIRAIEDELFLGSCSEKVIRKSRKPVLVVRR